MYQLIKPLLFLLSPEKAHTFTTTALNLLLRIPLAKKFVSNQFQIKHTSLVKELFGLRFENPVGLAAGFDKNAELIDDFSNLGFGFIEIGTLTPKGQPGNSLPRLFRLPKDNALINRMGFNNEGVDKAVERLKKRKSNLIIGGNIGKNKVTPNENAVDDYLTCFRKLYDHVDYFVVNVSSPNTPGLRELQEKEPLTQLLKTLQEERNTLQIKKPILLKIAPDLSDSQLDDIIHIVYTIHLDGLIVSNTTIERTKLKSPTTLISKIGPGGLSGAPVFFRSTEVLKYIKKRLPDVPIIAVGGIMSEADALEKLKAGADLIQIYTGLVYHGPGLIKRINKALIEHLDEG